jgi:hypothetical protein
MQSCPNLILIEFHKYEKINVCTFLYIPIELEVRLKAESSLFSLLQINASVSICWEDDDCV